MLAAHCPRRKPSSRVPFLAPRWDDNHPEFRKIDFTLPPDHHARWLAAVVSRLDLVPLRLSYAGRGSLAYLPDLLLTFVLFMYSKGILSPAEWVRQACYDDQSKWLLRGLRPCRSQLYAFRDRLGPFLDAWHSQLIAWAIAEKVTTASRASLDGTLVAALASRHRLMSCRHVDQRLLLLRLAVWADQCEAEGELVALSDDLAVWVLLGLLAWLLLHYVAWESEPARLPAWLPASVAGRARVLKRCEQARERLEQRLLPYRNKKKLSKKDCATVKRLKVSLTDPDAALGWDKVGTFRPLYNVMLVQATDAPLTLAWDVLGCSGDRGQLRPMMEKTKEQLGSYPKEAIIDGGFLSVGDVAWCEKEGIVVYAPPAKVEGTKAEGAKAAEVKAEEAGAKGKKGGAKGKKLPKKAFRYDGEGQAYFCPQGKRLTPASRTTEKRQGGLELPVIVYRASGEDCRACPQQKGCTSNPGKGRVVKRYEGEEALERLEQRMQESASQEVYKERCRSVELGNADLKEHRGLRVFRCFGKEGARTQAGLTILAGNGLKIVHALQRRQNAARTPSIPEKQPA